MITDEQHKAIRWLRLYLLWSSIAILSLLVATGVCTVFEKHFLSDGVLIALISFLGVNGIGMAVIVLKWLFKP